MTWRFLPKHANGQKARLAGKNDPFGVSPRANAHPTLSISYLWSTIRPIRRDGKMRCATSSLSDSMHWGTEGKRDEQANRLVGGCICRQTIGYECHMN